MGTGRGVRMRRYLLFALIAVAAVAVSAVPMDGSDGAEAPSESYAYDGSVYGYLKYYDDYHSAIVEFDAGTDTCMRLQSRLEGFEVWILGDRVLADSDRVETFVIPAGVRQIGSEVFDGCDSLKEIIFLGSMPQLQPDTFAGVPDGVQVRYLERFSDSWSGFTALGKSVLPVYVYSDSGCSYEYYVLDGSVTVLRHLSGQKITIPSTMTVSKEQVPVRFIEASAFFYDENSTQDRITSVKISEGLEQIGVAAFKYCEYLESVDFPSSLIVIYDEAFRMPIDNRDYDRSALKEVNLPDGLRYIGFEAFRMCYQLKTIVVPESVTHYGDGAFRVCAKAERVELNAQIEHLGEYSFDNCYALREVILPDGLKSIGPSCFYGDRSLESIVLPSSVRSVGVGAFSGCVSLFEVTMPDDAEILTGCFYKTPLSTVVINGSDGSGNGILATYFKNGSWTLPGMEGSGRLTLLGIDTDDSVDLGIAGVKGCITLSDAAVNTTGGTFTDGSKELVGKDRAGKSYVYDGSWKAKDVATVKVFSEDISLGTVSGGGTYAVGDKIDIVASPKTYCRFVEWSDGNKDATRTITVSKDITLTAAFKNVQACTVTLTADPAEGGECTGAGIYTNGETATLTAIPADGYKFVKWSDGNKNATRDIVVDDDIALTAYFAVPGSGSGFPVVWVVVIIVVLCAVAGGAVFFLRSRKQQREE